MPNPTFCAIYRWRLHPGSEEAFVEAWSKITRLLLTERGSLGSRLHRGPDDIWYSYTQWPSATAKAEGLSRPCCSPRARSRSHTGGLLTREGQLAFPNATIHLSAAEWDALKKDSDAASLVAAMTPKVVTFAPGAAVVPGVVTAVEVTGHTPGHSAYEIQSGDERLLYIGDAAHHYVISVQRPEWTVQYDEDAPTAQASRRALLQRAAEGNLRIYSVHFPFPGLGHFKAQGDSFAWVPEG